jgi:hypothetical protein
VKGAQLNLASDMATRRLQFPGTISSQRIVAASIPSILALLFNPEVKKRHQTGLSMREIGEDKRALFALLKKQRKKRNRSYDLMPVGNRLMFVRRKFERMIEEAIADAYGKELERDHRDGTFL